MCTDGPRIPQYAGKSRTNFRDPITSFFPFATISNPASMPVKSTLTYSGDFILILPMG